MSTHNISFPNIKKSQICSYGIISKALKNEFETARVNEPSEFEPLKFYCILFHQCLQDFKFLSVQMSYDRDCEHLKCIRMSQHEYFFFNFLIALVMHLIGIHRPCSA